MATTRRKSISRAKIEKSIPPIHKNAIQKQETQSQISKSEPIIAEATPLEYENIREQRIKENKERFEKLGILNLSLKFNAVTPKPPGGPGRPSTRIVHTRPRRRSSRLSGEAPVIYWGTEVYNEEHEKLLGNTEKEWTLRVDGYGPHGNRLYDPLNGKTCHQCRQKNTFCRQKTLGLRTHCIKCQLETGQFCGDCLYMRYGEHIVEANENPNWICPPCRGICNCNFCRKAKGWRHTGNLYRTAKNLGFKSVAHYLIMTKRTPPSSTMVSEDSMEVEGNDSSEMELNIDGGELEETRDDEKESVLTYTANSNQDSTAS